MDALMGAGLPFGVTVHDLQMACPTITLQRADGAFCGGVTDAATCRGCLASQPAFAGVDIERWRERHGALLARAAFVIAPSRWAAETLARYFPALPVEVVPHGLPSHAGRVAQGTPGRADARRRSCDGGGARRDRAGQGRPPRRGARATHPRATPAAAHRRRRLPRHAARGVAERRRRAHGARPLRSARPGGAARLLRGQARAVPVVRTRDVRVHAERGVAGRVRGARAAARRARRARGAARRRLDHGRRGVARRRRVARPPRRAVCGVAAA